MPLITFKGKTYKLRWKQEWNDTVISIGKKYKRAKTIRWVDAIKAGEFNKLPLDLKTPAILSHQHTWLIQHNDPVFREKRRLYYSKRRTPPKKEDIYAKFRLFQKLPMEVKIENKCNIKRIWGIRQKEILIQLAKKYRGVSGIINWQTMVKDTLICKLPYRNIDRIRAYYHGYVGKKKGQLRRRESALAYNKEHYEQYKKNQMNRAHKVNRVVNSVLMEKYLDKWK